MTSRTVRLTADEIGVLRSAAARRACTPERVLLEEIVEVADRMVHNLAAADLRRLRALRRKLAASDWGRTSA